jgi:hypothetical protein
VSTHFGDSTGESTTLHMSSMKKGSSGTTGSDLDKKNIIKSTFDTMTEEGHKALKSYHANLDEFFYSCYEVMR